MIGEKNSDNSSQPMALLPAFRAIFAMMAERMIHPTNPVT